MKNIISNYHKVIKITMIAVLPFVYSCEEEFLENQPQGVLNEQNLATREGINSLLTAAYAGLDGVANGTTAVGGGGASWGASPSNFLHGSIAGGEAHKGAGGGSEIPMIPYQRWNAMDPSNPYLNVKWRYDYAGIARANAVLKILPAVEELSDADKNSIEAQARVIRSHFYFDLKKNWDMVPWVDESNMDQPLVPNDIDIWPMIEADFKFGMENLLDSHSEIGRVNKWAAASYLGKTYLYQQKYQEAKSIFDQVISDGQTSNGLPYALTENYNENFTAATENNSESVFVVQMVPNLGTNDVANSNGGDLLNYPVTIFACCGIFIPSQDLVNSFRTDDEGLPYLNIYNQHAIKSDQGLNSDQAFTPDQGPIDPRLDWSVGRRGIPYLDWGVHEGKAWIRDQAEAGPYSPIKNVHMQATQDEYGNYASWAPGNAINLNIIRFADVLLMAAEAEAYLGNLDQAQVYVNMVRARAANPGGWVYKYADETDPTGGRSDIPAANYVINEYPSGTFASQGLEFSLDAIRFERKLELGLEGHRYYDLSRWGTAAEFMKDYYEYESQFTTDLDGAYFTEGKNDVYPIPQAQIDLSTMDGESILEQNPEY